MRPFASLDDITQFIITLGFLLSFGYLLLYHVGNDEGSIKPDIVYSYLTGIMSAKIINTFFTKRG